MPDSRELEMTVLMTPDMANFSGKVHGGALLNLLDRLESSALFSEESCSFSQKDLVANLGMWVEKARGVLEQP